MIRRLKALFAWREVRRDNHWSYAENSVTGERRVRRHNFTRGWPPAPEDLGWVAGLPFGEQARRLGPMPPASED